MPTRRPLLPSFPALSFPTLWLPTRLFRTARLTLLALTGGLFSHGVHANVADVHPSAGFSYQTGHQTTIDITLTPTDGTPALLSFYSKGDNGLRLLHNAFTDGDGHYTGELQVPAHLDRVVVVIRSASRQEQVDLAVYNHAIAYTQ